MEKFHRTILITVFFAALWLASVGFGMRLLANYENKAGRVGVVPTSFPRESALTLAKDRPTLVMLAHPRCPCTRASIGELARIMGQLEGKVKAYVLFTAPPGAGADWNDTGLWHSAEEIPEVIPVGDGAGREARRFGAETSGHTLLFAADGHLLFNGGITQSRGHAGDNAGESAIVSLVKTGRADRAHAPVFGCAMIGSSEAPAKRLSVR